MLNILRFIGMLLTSVAMAAGTAHLLAMPNKMAMSQQDYFTVQQIYNGWAWLGVPILLAALVDVVIAVLDRWFSARVLAGIAAVCIVGGCAIFFSFTYPANLATRNWTVIPEDWISLRKRWEYSHAVAAILYAMSLGFLTASILSSRGTRHASVPLAENQR